MSDRYHCFWLDPYGMHHKYEAFDALEPVLALVKDHSKGPDEFSQVRGLRVIYGELMEFELATVVETRIKEPH